MNRAISWIVLSAFLLSPAVAQDQQTKPKVSYFTLDNGLQVLVIPDNRAPVVSQTIWYKVGSADDPVGQSGVAHFFEHLMFKGSEKYPAGALDRFVSESGGDHNAFTSPDVTAYLQSMPTSALPKIMDMEADRMRNLVLPESVIAAERSVVQNERRQVVDASPYAMMYEQLSATLYQHHPYRIPVIGWAHEIAELDREDALGVYERYYAPNNAVLVITGDVEVDEVKSLAEGTYGKLERGPHLEPRNRPKEPPTVASRTVTLEDARVVEPTMFRAWLVPSYRTAEPGESEALDLLNAVLSRGKLSRLIQVLSIQSNDAAVINTAYDGSGYDYGEFHLSATPQEGVSIETIDEKVTAEIEKIIRDGVSEDELARVKRQYARNLVFQLDNITAYGDYYGSWLANDMSLESLEGRADRIAAVTSDDIQAVAAKYLRREHSVTGYLVPAPADDDTADALNAPETTPAAQTEESAQ